MEMTKPQKDTLGMMKMTFFNFFPFQSLFLLFLLLLTCYPIQCQPLPAEMPTENLLEMASEMSSQFPDKLLGTLYSFIRFIKPPKKQQKVKYRPVNPTIIRRESLETTSVWMCFANILATNPTPTPFLTTTPTAAITNLGDNQITLTDDKRLDEMIIPGTHNSGAFWLKNDPAQIYHADKEPLMSCTMCFIAKRSGSKVKCFLGLKNEVKLCVPFQCREEA